tara:strand:- start:18954 stop:20327 length:1374 start_codon:yes stop_codon:yes gene_type:complete
MKRKAPGNVFDIETDGFDYTKIHCIAVDNGSKLGATCSYDAMRNYFSNAEMLVGHNIYRFDIPAVEEMLGIKVKAKLVDTLALSWYLEPKRVMHGLADYGEDYGIPKPKVDDWVGLSPAEYKNRCREDVKINTTLWEKQWAKLLRMYETEEEAWKLVDYLMFKMECAREQEERRWKIDVPKATELRGRLSGLHQEAVTRLEEVMPDVPVYTKKTKPKKPYKQDGTLSALGEKWFALLKEHDLPEDTEEMSYISSYNKPNAASDPQIKAWLAGLGWIPCTFKFKRDKDTGDLRQIPQVRKKNDDNEPILTPSVERLCEEEPAVRALQEVGVIKHRLDVVSGFLDNMDDEGYVQARIQGFTNTLRFKHRVVVNLPGVDKPYGEELRGCLIAPEGYELCGSDMTALEDRTKQHYMIPHDPEYVETMNEEGYCPHVDIAKVAGYVTDEEEKFYRWYKKNKS